VGHVTPYSTAAAQRLLNFIACQGDTTAADGAAAVRADGAAQVVARLLDSVQISPEARRLSAS